MDTVRALWEFLNSYPVWAKLVALFGVLLALGTLILAPRQKGEAAGQSDTSLGGEPFLCIRGVDLYPHREGRAVQVIAIVDGTEYRYPTLSGIEWLQVGPTMSPQCFRLPKRDQYSVRFEMKLRRAGGETERLVSLQEVLLKKLPFDGTYPLHVVDETRYQRSAAVTAELRFRVEYR